MNQFVKRMKDLEAEVNALKAAAYFGTASLSAISKTAQVAVELEYYTTGIGGANEYAHSTQICTMEIDAEENEGFLCSIKLISGQNEMKGRRCWLSSNMRNGKRAYDFQVALGSQSDIDTLKNGGTIRFNLTFRVTCTSNFTLNVTYRTNPHD